MQKNINIVALPARYTLEVIAWLFVLIPTIPWVYGLILKVLSDENPAVKLESYSAFFGAFFAALFVFITEKINKYRERHVRHYNALCGLEDWLIETGNVINDNHYLLPGYRKTIVSGNVYSSFPKLISREKIFYRDLLDLELANKVLALNDDIRRVNDDTENVNNWYMELRRFYISGTEMPNKYQRDTYIANSQIVATQLKVIEAALIELKNSIVDVMSLVRLRMKLDKSLGQIIKEYVNTLFSGTAEKDALEKEKSKFLNEIENSRILSNPRIERLRERAEKIRE